MEENNSEIVQKEENEQNGSETKSQDVVISKKELTEYITKLEKEAKNGGRVQGIVITLIVTLILAFIVTVASNVVSSMLYGGQVGSNIIDKEVEEKTQKLYNVMNKYFLWDVDREKVKDGIYKGIFESLDDPYSVYYTKEEFDELMETSSGQYSGIGAYIGQKVDSNELFISRPMPGSPAEKAGLLTDDVIVEVDGENVVGQDINLVVSKIKGVKGTTVNIGVKRKDVEEILTIPVTRDTIEVAMLESEMLDDNVGYIFIYSFEQTTFSQFEEEYKKLKEQGMKSLIIDLRDNPGGDFDIAIKLADYILPEGTIVYTKDKDGKGERYESDKNCIDMPIVVLINGNSASASEVVAGAIKDNNYATLVGEKTFGKGIVQVVLGLKDGSGFKITQSEYYLPNDECIHKIGIEPDVLVELDYERYKKEKYDNQKIKAWEIAKKKQEEKEAASGETNQTTQEDTKESTK